MPGLRLIRHSEALATIDTRIGQIEINHPPGHRITVCYQDIEHEINVRLLVLSWPRQ